MGKRFGVAGALVLVVILAVAVLTVLSSQKQQETRSRAKNKPSSPPHVTISPTSESLLLTKQETVRLPDTTVTLLLQEVRKPSERCRDCITYAKVDVQAGTEVKTIEFKEGGFAGIIQDTQEAFGYVFTLNSVEENAITLSYKKQ